MSIIPSSDFQLSRFIREALHEDMGAGDVTTESIVPKGSGCAAAVKVKEPLVVAGIDIFFAIFKELDPYCGFSTNLKDGDRAPVGRELGTIKGDTRAVLTGERTALNILQRMCGIATLTARYVEKTVGTSASIADTRKTVPLLRALDKYAVKCGGGVNHRFGLFSGILIKDNHIKAAGSIKEAVKRAVLKKEPRPSVEVETASMEQVDEALEAGADIIMLDNMSVEGVRECVERIRGRVRIEVSGGINLDTVREYALAGPDLISVGALTHSPGAVDISLDFV